MTLWKTLLLSFVIHGLACFLLMASIFGIPGKADPAHPIPKIFDVFLNAGWFGIPNLFLISIAQFCFRYPRAGWTATVASLALDVAVFSTILFYNVRSSR